MYRFISILCFLLAFGDYSLLFWFNFGYLDTYTWRMLFLIGFLSGLIGRLKGKKSFLLYLGIFLNFIFLFLSTVGIYVIQEFIWNKP